MRGWTIALALASTGCGAAASAAPDTERAGGPELPPPQSREEAIEREVAEYRRMLGLLAYEDGEPDEPRPNAHRPIPPLVEHANCHSPLNSEWAACVVSRYGGHAYTERQTRLLIAAYMMRGDRAHARASALTYLRRFPESPFHAEIRVLVRY